MVKKALLLLSVLFVYSQMAGQCLAAESPDPLGDASAQLQQAETYKQDGQYEQAEAIYQQIVTDFPDSNDALEAQKQLTILYVKQDNQPQADAALQKLLADFYMHKDIAKAVNKVGDHYRWSRKYELARQLYQYVVDNWPQAEYAIWSQKSLAISNIALADDPNAAAAIEKLLTNFSEHKQIARAVYNVADTYTILKKYEKARQLYQYVVDNWPQSNYAMWSQKGLATSNIQLGDAPNAAAAIEKLLTNFSEHKQIARAVYNIAHRYSISKRYERACELYQYVIDHWPDDEYAIWSEMEMAEINILSLIESGDAPNAAAAIEKLLTNFSEHKQIARAVYNIADHYRWSRQYYEEARQLYQYVVDNWPDDEYAIWSQKSLATSSIQLGDDPNAAAAAIEKLLTNFSEHKQIARAVYKVADRYRISKRYEKACELYQYVIDHWPDDEYAMQSEMEMAGINVLSLIESGDEDEAQEALDRLIADFNDHPDLPAVLYDIAERCEKTKKYEEARELYQYVIDHWPDDEYAMRSEMEVAKTNVLSLIESGDDPNAQAALDRLIADFNGHRDLPKVVFRIGEEYSNQAFRMQNEGRDAEAKDYCTKAIAVWERIIQEFPPSGTTADAYFISAACYHHLLAEYEKAIEYYRKIVDNWPDYERAGKAQFLIGLCYQGLKNSGGLPQSVADAETKVAYETLLQNYPNCIEAMIARDWLMKSK